MRKYFFLIILSIAFIILSSVSITLLLVNYHDLHPSYLPYKEPEESCKAAGFDTLVFIPSQDEEDGLITCGNAILVGVN